MFDLDGERTRFEVRQFRFGATEVVNSLAVWQNQLVAGLAAGNSPFSAAIVFSDGGAWKTLDLPGKQAGVYCLLNHHGSLYAGTFIRGSAKANGAAHGARVLKLSTKGWRTLLGGDDQGTMVMTMTSTPETVYGSYN